MKNRIRTLKATLGMATALLLATTSASASFVSFVIRGAPVVNNNTPAPGVTEFITLGGGQKAALGSSDIDGRKVGDIANMAITRVDNWAGFSATTAAGARAAPYFNLWITDGTHYAVVANEPTDAEWTASYNGAYNFDWNFLKTKKANIYENADKSWLPNNGVGLTFADLENFVIDAPSVAELTTGWAGLGSGAPRELGTNLAYGVNWIFGDTLSNYVSGDPGFRVSGASVTAVPVDVPEPGSLALAGLALSALVAGTRRAQASRTA